MRVTLRIEVLVHILQCILDTNLLAVADAPDGIERQALNDRRFEDEHRRGSTARDKVRALGIELGNRLGKHTVIPCVHHSDAVRSDECTAILLACVEDVLFTLSSFSSLFAETCRNDDEGAHLLFGSKVIDIVGTILGSHHKDSQLSGRYLLGIVESLDALNLILLWIDNTERALVSSLNKIANDGASRLMHVVRAAYHYYALGM